MFPAVYEISSDSTTSEEEEEEDSSSEPESPKDSDLEMDFILPDIDKGRDAPAEELIVALETLTLSSLQMQMARRLPFLVRNLRKGFEGRCRLVGVPVRPVDDSRVSVHVIYRCKVSQGGRTSRTRKHQARMDVWRCPLCELHGAFKTREMLVKHLEWDHAEVACSWKQTEEVSLFSALSIRD